MPTRVALIVTLLLAGPAVAQPTPTARLLRTFDFEESRLGNIGDLPMHWAKASGPGLPHWARGQLATDRSRSGNTSFRFDLDGGSIIYRYPSGRITAQRGAHYRVEVFLQTTELTHARPRLTAYFTDRDHRPITSTTHHSPLLDATSPGDDWHRLRVELSADEPTAQYLVIELGLLQPALYGSNSLRQDVSGQAWFDDLSVYQIPKLTFTTGRPGHAFVETPSLQIAVDDLVVEDLVARLVVRDADGRVVAQRTGALAGKYLNFVMNDLHPGWHEATLELISGRQAIDERRLSFVVLPQTVEAAPSPLFGVIVSGLPLEKWDQLPALLPQLGAARVKLPIRLDDRDPVGGATLNTTLVRLRERGVAAEVNLLHSSAAEWKPALAELAARHGAHVARWQIGADGSDALASTDADAARKLFDEISGEIEPLVWRPQLAIPWPATHERPASPPPAAVALAVPTSVLPSQLPLYIHEWNGTDVSLSLAALEQDRYDREARRRDLAQRVILALAAGVRRIDLPLSLAIDEQTLQPSEMFLTMRALSSALGGAEFKGRVPLSEGIEAFLFDKSGQGVVALWSRGDEATPREVTLDLGPYPRRMDLLGNVSPLLRIDRREPAKLIVGPTPMFLIDVDSRSTQLRASVAIDRPLLESRFGSHTRRLSFTNPYPHGLSGKLRLRGPAGWVVEPPTLDFSLASGQTFQTELTIRFPLNSTAGHKTLEAELHVEGETETRLAVPILLRVGLSDVGMQSIALRDGGDVTVQQTITNYGDKPVSYTCFALCPNAARQERLALDLPPGQSTIKRYRFSKADLPSDATIRVGLHELNGMRVLNDELVIP